MSLFALADTHLSLNDNKSMEIFEGWENYVERIRTNWQETVSPDDTVVINGDVSWSMSTEGARRDLEFIHGLPGRKIISKGNHDYWWDTLTKLNRFIDEWGFDSISFLHNNCFEYEGYGICGTRGWVNDDTEPEDAKVIAREAGRLEMSVAAAEAKGLEPVVFLHYPPYYGNQRNDAMIEVLHRHGIKRCYYGHLHGKAHRFAINGEMEGVYYRLVSADFLKFMPYRVL